MAALDWRPATLHQYLELAVEGCRPVGRRRGQGKHTDAATCVGIEYPAAFTDEVGAA